MAKHGWTRRELLQGMGVGLGALALGCRPEPLNPDAVRAAGFTPLSAADRAKNRDTLSGIDTFVVLCFENRSFDHFLGTRRSLEGRNVNGLTGNETNPSPAGLKVGLSPLEEFRSPDCPHSWDAARIQWNQGRNDGFVRANAGPEEAEVMAFYQRAQLPMTYAIADQATVADSWHSAVLGPTWPNRFYLETGTSGGLKSNKPILGLTSAFDAMDRGGATSANYFHDFPFGALGYGRLTHNRTIEQFFDDAVNGTLPNFSLIDPQYLGSYANDDHCSHDVRRGQVLIGAIHAALALSPQWKRTMFIVTYDEHGGFYDHVSPGTAYDERPEFRQLGFRVPSIIAGPHVAPGAVISTPFDHVSILSTLTTRFELTPLNDRVSATNDLSSCVATGSSLGLLANRPSLPVLQYRSADLAPGEDDASEHPEMQDALNTSPLPPSLDRRAQGERIANFVLERAADLGTLSLDA